MGIQETERNLNNKINRAGLRYMQWPWPPAARLRLAVLKHHAAGALLS